NEILELRWIAHEKNRRVIAHQIIVPILGVELDRESSWVTHRIGRACFSRDRGEAYQYRGALAHPVEECRLCPGRRISRYFEVAKRAAPFGMDNALGYPLAVELRHLLNEIVVLQQQRSFGSDRKRIFIAWSRYPCISRGSR